MKYQFLMMRMMLIGILLTQFYYLGALARRSDNDEMKMDVKELSDKIVEKKPKINQVKDINETECSKIISYDLSRGEEKTLKYDSIGAEDKNKTSNHEIIQTSSYKLESIIGSDDRYYVNETYVYPFSSVCKIFTFWPDNSISMGTGAIVSATNHGFNVLTAGHCVYDVGNGFWASGILVIPGYDLGYKPFYHAWAAGMASFTGWVVYGYTEYDLALVTLDRNVGDYTGWMGFATYAYTNPVYSGVLYTAGYPGDLSDGYAMYWTYDYGYEADEYLHYYWLDTYGGQSGSPVWYWDSQDEAEYILTVHTNGGGGTYPNWGTRINSNKYSTLVSWLSSASVPIDYANLIDDGQLYSGFSPSTVDPGETILDLWYDVRNIGTGNSEAFSVSYYLSDDDIITVDDLNLGSTEISNVTPFNYVTAYWSGTIPSEVTDGVYYVGWIIDSENKVSEPLDNGENNNVGYDDELLTVLSNNTVSFYTNSPATIQFDGVSYNHDKTGYFTDGTYEITANPYTDYRFHHWEYDNIGQADTGVYIPDNVTQTTYAYVDGDGWLKSVYEAKITFYADPTEKCAINYGSSVLVNEDVVWEMNYSISSPIMKNISALADPGYEFDHWETEGMLAVENSTSEETMVLVSGAGSLKAVFNDVTYSVEITAYCVSCNSSVNVGVVIDDESYITPAYFTGLYGDHTAAAPSHDGNPYHVFKEWMKDQAHYSDQRNIAISSGGNYTIIFKIDNEPPAQPQPIYPQDNQAGVPCSSILSWEVYDEDHDTLLCNLYLGSLPDPLLLLENLTEQFYVYENLVENTTYYWRIEVSDGTYTVMSPVWSFTTSDISHAQRHFNEGWNLMALPNNNKDIEDVFTGNLDEVEACYGYEAGSWYFWLHTPYTTLENIKDGAGYWIKVTTQFDVEYNHSPINMTSLNVGWNLISTTQCVTVEDYIASSGVEIKYIYGYSDETKEYSYWFKGLGSLNTLEVMYMDRGYWVFIE